MTVSRRVRRTWLVIGSAFTIVMLGFGTLQAVTQVAHSEHTESRSFAATEVARVDLESDSGDVSIVGTDESRVSVTARISDGLRSTDHSVDVVGDRLVLRATCPGFLTSFCRVDFMVRVPTTVAVRVRAGNDVELSDIEGQIDVETDHGDLDARRLDGDAVRLVSRHGSVRATDVSTSRADASSDHGDVVLEFVTSGRGSATDPDRIDATSAHGDIAISVPRSSESYRVEATSDHGSVDTLIRTDPSSARTIRAHSDHGDVSVRYSASR